MSGRTEVGSDSILQTHFKSVLQHSQVFLSYCGGYEISLNSELCLKARFQLFNLPDIYNLLITCVCCHLQPGGEEEHYDNACE